MQHSVAGRIRMKRAPRYGLRAPDTTVFPIAMIVVLTVVLVLLMLLAVRQ